MADPNRNQEVTADLAVFLNRLPVGSILFFATPNLIGEVSAFFDNSAYNHCGLYLGDGTFIHATIPVGGDNCVVTEHVEDFVTESKVSEAAAALLDAQHQEETVARAIGLQQEGARFAYNDMLLVPAIVDSSKHRLADDRLLDLLYEQTELEVVLLELLQVGGRDSLTCSEFVGRALPEALAHQLDPQIRRLEPFVASDGGEYDQEMSDLRADLEQLDLTDGLEHYTRIYRHLRRWSAERPPDARFHQRLVVEVFRWAVNARLAAAKPLDNQSQVLARIAAGETLDDMLNLVSPGDLLRAPFATPFSLRYCLPTNKGEHMSAEIDLGGVVDALTTMAPAGETIVDGGLERLGERMSDFGTRLVGELWSRIGRSSGDAMTRSEIEAALIAEMQSSEIVKEIAVALAAVVEHLGSREASPRTVVDVDVSGDSGSTVVNTIDRVEGVNVDIGNIKE